MVKHWEDLDIEHLRKNYALVDNISLADDLFRSPQAIRSKAHSLGLKKDKPIVDEKFFDEIDRPDKAYWIGLLWADGSIWQRRGYDSYTLKLELQKRDAVLVQAFAKAISSNKKPVITSKTCRFDLHNYHLCQSLIDKGIIPNKTHSDGYPIISYLFPADFIRGVFDGDGTVYIDRSDKGQLKFGIAGNIKLCLFVRDYLRFGSVSPCGNANNTYQWRSGGKHVARRFYDVIYYDEDLPCLERKRNLFECALGVS